MALLGQAAIAMWWEVAAEWQQEFERGGPDPAADWVDVVTGYSEEALRGLRQEEAADDVLFAHGATRNITASVYRLSCAVTPADFA